MSIVMPVGSGIVVALVLVLAPASRAQSLNQLQGLVSPGQGGGALPGLGAGLPSTDQATPGNAAGILQYCVRNNYLSGGAASSVKDALMGKTGGGASGADFKEGSSGMLQTGNGQSYGLGGSGIKAQVTHKVCDLVLKHAKSLL